MRSVFAEIEPQLW